MARTRTATGTLRWRRGRWTAWNGKRWARAVYAVRPQRLESPELLDRDPQLTDQQRTVILGKAIDDLVLKGAVILRQDHDSVIIAVRRPVSHVLHALLTLITGGLWGIGWLVNALSRTDDRVRLRVDAWGNVWPSVSA
ncbi:hypothetical protein [Nocardioides pacificus]